MNRVTGEIISEEEAMEINKKFPGLAMALRYPPTAEQTKNKKIGRNDPCPCLSGKKFKKCCLIELPNRG